MILLKLKQGLDNDAQINETVGNISNGRFVIRLSLRPQTAGQGFVGRKSPFAHRFSAATARKRERTHVSLLARPAIVPLAALCSLSAFAPPIAYAFSATISRCARASSPGPWKCPAITQLGITDTSGLELSQLSPDASPSVPPPSNVHSSGINPNLSKQPLCDSPSGVHVSPMFVIFHPSFSTSPLP